MSEDENKAIQRGLVDEIFNRHDPEAVERFFAPDYVEHAPFAGQEPGLEGLKRLLAEGCQSARVACILRDRRPNITETGCFEQQ